MNGDRRRFLSLGAAGLAGSTLFPRWIAPTFAAGTGDTTVGDAADESARSELIETAAAHARSLGKPLLAIVIPEDEEQRTLRGYLWGHFLAGAGDEALANLCLCSLVCSDESQLARRFPKAAKKLSGTPLAWLIETDGAGLDGTGLDSTGLVGRPIAASIEDLDPRKYWGRGAELGHEVDALNERVAKLLEGEIVADRKMLERRAKQVAGTLTQTELMSTAFPEHPEPRPKLKTIDRIAGKLRLRAEEIPAEREAWLALLAGSLCQRVWEQDPVGARWRQVSDYCPPCGMGHTPAISRHFLEFYTAQKFDPKAAGR